MIKAGAAAGVVGVVGGQRQLVEQAVASFFTMSWPLPAHDEQGRAMVARKESDAYKNASSGRGSIRSVAQALFQKHIAVDGSRVLMHRNKPDGFMRVSCGLAKPNDPLATGLPPSRFGSASSFNARKNVSRKSV